MIVLKKENLSLLLFLIPLSYVLGPAITEPLVLLSILSFFFLYREKDFYLDPKILFLFSFAIYVFFSSIFQLEGKASEGLKLSSLTYFRFIFFSLSICFLCKLLSDSRKISYYKFFIFFFIILIFDSLFQFFFGFNLIGYEIKNNRISSFFGNELILGGFLIKMLPIIVWYIFFFEIDLKKKNLLYFVIFFTTYFIAIYIAGGRTALFLCIFFIFSVIVLIKNIRIIFFISFLLTIIFAVTISNLKIGKSDPLNRQFIKTFNQFTDHQLDSNADNEINLKNLLKYSKFYSKDHEGHIELSIELFKQNKIFGVGPKGFRYFCRIKNYDPDVGICSTHPHNLLFQFISELGLVGILFYVIAFSFLIMKASKYILNKNNELKYYAFYAATLGLIINLFPLIPSGNFFNNWISIILYYNIGIYLYSYKKCITTC